ncbi:hypothetical protein IW261DRAFT_1466510 [Armillaria novae-zelandiae]|uniref:WW domain-containing protein n=1 Tax=Armillaria novae-zelandiae TaxID=153914 RepID=A0AA39PH06_9AGAR|nr:hypothetical protein IW261DRAFT_1466510 [Armillaria novae-zelandiae]
MQSISSLAAPSHRIQDTADEDHASSSLVVVEREFISVTSSLNSESSKSTVISQTGLSESTHDWSNVEKQFEKKLPSSIGHYKRKTFIDEFYPAKFTVPAMQTDFNTYTCILPQTEEEVLPVGWAKHTHSDGKSYFYHDHDRIITEEWLYDKVIAKNVARYISILKDAISKRAQRFDRLKSWHLYIEITEHGLPSWEGDSCFRCRYYFVNHDAECIFWLSECELDDYLLELRGEMSPDLIRRYLQTEYWTHHYYFSEVHQLMESQWQRVQKSILLAKTDVIMSNTSTVTYNIEKLKTMGDCITLAEELDASEVAASYMIALLRDQIYNYHGQRNVRTARDESVYGYRPNNTKHTVLFRTMNLLLLYAPIKHHTALNKVWVDRLISRGPWQRLIGQITDKWQQQVGLATILLAVNMAFLAIPSVDEMGAGQRHWFATQLLCYLSVASSTATIILGLILTSHHNSLKHAEIPDVTYFLERHWQQNIGFERLSIMYSSPYSLLMWSMVTFLASFLSMCLEASNPVLLKVFVALVFLLGTVLCVWCIYMFWDGSDEWMQRCLEFWPEALSRLKAKLRAILSYDNIRRFRKKLHGAVFGSAESILPTTSGGVV